MDEIGKQIITTLVVGVCVILIMAVGLSYLEHDTKHIEGEVLGKEDKQNSFLSSTPNMLVINGTGRVSVQPEVYHSFEKGDLFNETVSLNDLPGYRDINKLFLFVLPLCLMVTTASCLLPLYRLRLR